MAYNTRFEENYVELYAYVCGQRKIYEDKLNILKIEAKTLFITKDKYENLELQTQIRATEAYLEALDKYVVNLSNKYKEIAMEFNAVDCKMFIEMFIDRVPSNVLAEKYHLTEGRVRNKKAEWTRKIRNKLRRKLTIPKYASDGIRDKKLQK